MRAALLLLACGAVLAGCYLPQAFEADLTIDREGRFAFRYHGDLLSLSMLGKIGRGEIADEDVPALAEVHARDLARDSGFRQVDHLGRGRFRTVYEKQGDIRAQKTFTFVRTNSRFLALKLGKDNLAELYGDKPNPTYVQELVARGLDVRGQLRVWTDAEIVHHNADTVVDIPRRVYIWDVRTITGPLPSIILALE